MVNPFKAIKIDKLSREEIFPCNQTFSFFCFSSSIGCSHSLVFASQVHFFEKRIWFLFWLAFRHFWEVRFFFFFSQNFLKKIQSKSELIIKLLSHYFEKFVFCVKAFPNFFFVDWLLFSKKRYFGKYLELGYPV